ncbi:DNA methylase N-4/N-6 domain protein [Chloroherpeton thalassium ATCC 35110]|uniref:Methyltransferase n=1 Tax=Chloroherpeton thalassium (strain ATCC 35110 / GB-78) TaxID=517418 RepID=B3QW36_CHLT3|nr:site-specific DNA-methyltransferase [Chloroherpeton thalassium]ACF14690.1 DNA methylase N-4/N-6 domain protein [Chloroherpeton thalassium ATCC 35110]
MKSEHYEIYNKSCYGLGELKDNSIDAMVTDPPYGISYQNNYWDKDLPDKKIWEDSVKVLKPGSFGLVFSSVRLMHRLMVALEDAGFLIKDVMFWSYLNGMPKSRDVALDIDKELGSESKVVGKYNYVQGYKKNGAENYYAENKKLKYEPTSELGVQYKGSGLGIKPAYEPVILIQKPLEKGLSVAKNIIKYGTGALNIENTRIPYAKGETKVGHNPHPKGRVAANIIRTEPFSDEYDKFFVIPKVRQKAEEFNDHPTLKPVELMHHLVKLVSFENQTVLDPFMGSGSTGVACLTLKRKFIGYELDERYYEICKKRIDAQKIINESLLF